MGRLRDAGDVMQPGIELEIKLTEVKRCVAMRIMCVAAMKKSLRFCLFLLLMLLVLGEVADSAASSHAFLAFPLIVTLHELNHASRWEQVRLDALPRDNSNSDALASFIDSSLESSSIIRKGHHRMVRLR
jgi:hypothetical protein